LIARVRNHETAPANIAKGKHSLLAIEPPDDSYEWEDVTFHI